MRCPADRAKLGQVDGQACGTEPRDAAAGHLDIRVGQGDHHPGQTGGDERVSAGRRAAMVGTGFQADPGDAASNIKPTASSGGR